MATQTATLTRSPVRRAPVLDDAFVPAGMTADDVVAASLAELEAAMELDPDVMAEARTYGTGCVDAKELV